MSFTFASLKSAGDNLTLDATVLNPVEHKDEPACRLLAIDDHPLSTDLIVRIARRCGYDAQGLVETRSLAEVLLKFRPDVITLDLNMPRADGSDVLTLLKVMGFAGQVIIISGLHASLRDAARRQAEAAGVNIAGTMGKPVDLKALRDVLGDLKTRAAAHS